MKKIMVMMVLACSVAFAQEVYATFDVVAAQHADLAFSASGVVKEVRVSVGSQVHKGDVLVRLQNSDLQAALRVAQAELQQAEVNYKYAKRAYERQSKVKKLLDENVFDGVSAKYENAQVALHRAKANVAYKKALLEKTSLKAPFDGVIYKKMVEVGDVVSGAMIRTILQEHSLHKRKLLLYFDQKYHNIVKIGDKFVYRLDGETQKREGVIRKIYPYANEKNRKMVAEVLTQDTLVGLFGDGYIKVK